MSLKTIIEEAPSFFHSEFSLYNLGCDLDNDDIEDKYISYFAENSISPRISAYFDPNYYQQNNPDVHDAGMEALAHFCNFGIKEKRSPHPLIDLYFISDQMQVEILNLAQLSDYIKSNNRTSPYFDSQFYLDAYRDIAMSDMTALYHFIIAGGSEQRLPNPYFNYEIYKHEAKLDNVDGFSAFIDHVVRGDKEKVEFSKNFDYNYYYENYSDHLNGESRLYRHYVIAGKTLNFTTKPKVILSGKQLISSESLYYEFKERIAKRKLSQDNSKIDNALFEFSDENEMEAFLEKLKAFPASEKPDISILIPVYKAKKELIECIYSIYNSTLENLTFEIIIADDCVEDDEIQRLLADIPSIKYIKNDVNLGFLRNVNNAIEFVSAEVTLLLNSDIQLEESCIKNLYFELLSDKNIGVTGPKILYPNGLLQEAGGSVKPNLETGMCGHGENPDDPRFNFSRDVDYISGACLAFATNDFIGNGKFDEELQPAYCEDLDYCLRVTQSGKKVRYVNSAIAHHHLSVSMNTKSPLFKIIQTAKNKNYLLKKHSKYLQSKSKKVIALYLPQFHETKRNNLWWGKGFTEWTGANNAKPNFIGHYQPHVSSELGFYNLTSPESHLKQEIIAKENNIAAFCFYYYNFGKGNEILQRALETYLASGSKMPFMLCWANENWTRTWDGEEKNVLLKQEANSDTDFLQVLKDMERFIISPNNYTINGKKAICIYRASQFENFQHKISLWRDYWREKYDQELHIILFDSMERVTNAIPPEKLGADAAVEFPPHGVTSRTTIPSEEITNHEFKGTLVDYQDAVEELLLRKHPGYKRYPSTFPSWDNTPRRQDTATIFTDSHPSIFQVYFEEKMKESDLYSDDEKLVFVNAWNEWGEGTHLEPDIKFGRTYLQIINSLVGRNN
jgi:GT2 family glycosyltransferase